MRKHGRASILNENDLKRVVEVQEGAKYSLRNIALLHFSLYLGLKTKEMAELSVKDVISPDGHLREEIFLTRKRVKGEKQRVVFLTHSKIRSTLTDYLIERTETDPHFGVESPLFKSQKNSRFTPQTLSMLFRQIYDKAGLDNCSSHSGRRSFATALLNQGINIKNVQTLLGHSSVNTTSLYVETPPAMLGDISKNLKI